MYQRRVITVALPLSCLKLATPRAIECSGIFVACDEYFCCFVRNRRAVVRDTPVFAFCGSIFAQRGGELWKHERAEELLYDGVGE